MRSPLFSSLPSLPLRGTPTIERRRRRRRDFLSPPPRKRDDGGGGGEFPALKFPFGSFLHRPSPFFRGEGNEPSAQKTGEGETFNFRGYFLLRAGYSKIAALFL